MAGAGDPGNGLMRGLLHGLRRFLAWQARVFLREEEWVFDAFLDLADLIDAIDDRLNRKPAPKGVVVWVSPWRTFSVYVMVSNRIEIFGGGWWLIPRLFGGMYFSGVLADGTLKGRLRQSAFPRAFLLLFVNLILVFLLIDLSVVVYQTGGCLMVDGDYCGYSRNAAGVLVGGLFFAVIGYIIVRLFAWVLGGGRREIHTFLADITMTGASG